MFRVLLTSRAERTRLLLFLFFGVWHSSTNAQINWTSRANPRVALKLHGVHFINANSGTIVGDSGAVYGTIDGGQTWDRQVTRDTRTLYCALQLDARTSLVAGDNGFVERTSDGGLTWSDKGPGGRQALTSMCVMPSGAVLACGSRCCRGRSSNGGEYWQFYYSPYPGGGPETTFAAIAMLKPGTAVMVGNPTDGYGTLIRAACLYASTNDGVSWNPRGDSMNGIYWGVACCDTDVVVVVGGKDVYDPLGIVPRGTGIIRRTTDLGATWTDIPNSSSLLFATSFYGKRLGFAVGQFGTVLRTTDAGLTWSGQASGIRDDLRAVQCIDSLHIIAASAKGYALRSDDGGLTWHRQPLDIVNSFFGACADSRGGFAAVGDLGAFLTCTDSSPQFSLHRLVPPRNLRSIAFPSPTCGIAVGLRGSVMCTADAGTTWTFRELDSNVDLQHLVMFDSLHGVVAGSGGAFLATRDGGINWIAISRSGTQALNCILALDSMRGIAVGDSGTLLFTTTSGQTWTSGQSSFQADLYAVAFNKSGVGLAGGIDGTMLRTTDGGATWHRVPLFINSDVEAIVFLDSLRCFCICAHSSGLQSIDGGITWNLSTTFPGTSPQSMCINVHGNVFVADDGMGGFVGTPSPLSATSRWIRAQPRFGAGENFVGIEFSDSIHGTVVHFNGTLTSTTDACRSWQTTNSGCPTGTYAFQRITTGLWETISNGALWRTSDAGKTWTFQLPLGATSHGGVHFLDMTHGAIAADANVWITNDGGHLWVNCTPPELDYPQKWLTSAWTESAATVFVVGSGGIIRRTADGGRTWATTKQGNTSDLYQVRGNGTGLAFAIGDNGAIHRTSDDGDTWTSMPSPTGATLCGDIAFFDERRALIVGKGGTILLTTDAGVHWTGQTSHSSENLFNIQIVDAGTAFIAGAQRTILRTTDSGATWCMLASNDKAHLLSVAHLDANVAVAVGMNGRITRTTDGGTLWSEVPSATQHNLRNVICSGADQFLCVGDSGVILRSSDAGIAWDAEASGVNLNIAAVSRASGSVYCAVGDSGLILRSSDSGIHWTRRSDTIPNAMASLWFPTPTHGVAVGTSGSLLHSTDGGITWQHVPNDPASNISAIAFLTSTTAAGCGTLRYWYELGSHGGHWETVQSFFSTSDGGYTWRSRPQNGYWSSLSMGLTPDSILFITTTTGAVKFSNDSGATWSDDPTSNNSALEGASFYSYARGILVGDHGTILRTLNPGQSVIRRSNALIDFGTVALDTFAVDSIVVTNLTSSTVIDSLSYTGDYDFSCPQRSLIIPPYGIARYLVTFRPSMAGHYAGVMKFSSTTYSYVDEVLLAGSGAGPAMTFDRLALSFNNAAVGEKSIDSVNVTNTGTAPLVISSITSDDSHFTTSASSMSLRPFEHRTIAVTFVPDSARSHSAMLRFTHNAPQRIDSLPMLAQYVSRVEDEPFTIPSAPVLEQTYPNPVHSEGGAYAHVTLGFTLPKAGHAQLSLFGTNGEKIAVLQDKYFDAGHYELHCDLGWLRPGTYAYALFFGSTVFARLLICQ